MLSAVGAVVIGRNEGPRLDACLASLIDVCERLVYVDSGSTDGSVALARAAGAEVVELDMSVPFTAARARNAGLAALEAGEAPQFVQFVDGDCTVHPGWVETARTFLATHPRHAVVCGRRREQAPQATLYNRLADMEWNTPIGTVAACGGDAMMRRAALDTVGGFREDLIAGEEPELCLRLRRAGWRIERLDAEMTRHDAGITRFSQWWRRSVRSGWAAAEGADLHGKGPERYNVARLRSIVIWGALVPGIVVLAAGVAALMAIAASPAATIPVLMAAGALSLLALQGWRIADGRQRDFRDPSADARLYGLFTMLGKLPQMQGVLRYLTQARTGRRAELIEYRGES